MEAGSTSELRAPGVVAVVVARDPGPWFGEVLAALAAQDYPNLSVLVLVVPGSSADGAVGDAAARVAAHLPDAYVHRLGANRGFGAAVNEALGMVEGASFFLLCHDDCAPAPDAVRLMVEESFRSNAGIVSPKLVRWDDERALLHVGQLVDKTGKVVERVHDGEIDAGQHDAVRDVFVAPGGLVLVRADLLRALGGYDPEIPAMGEDLDLSWRAHVAGARVVVAPAALARHLELVAAGARQPPPSQAPSLQALQRRHELRAALACYSWPHLVRVLPQAVALAVGELVVALVVGDAARARAIVHAWSWNLSQRNVLRRRRASLRGLRTVPDSDVRSLQVQGSARLTTYASRLVHHGAEAAHGKRRVAGTPNGSGATEMGDAWQPAAGEGTIGFGYAFSEDADFDDLDDLGHRGRRHHDLRDHPLFASRRARVGAWLVLVAVLVIGSRGLLTSPLPLLGQYVAFPSWTGSWHQLLSSWQPAGVGSSSPASPGFGLLGLLGTFVVGRMGALQELLVLGCIPVGAWGMARLLRPFGSSRARFAGTVAYLLLPLAYDALARGHWDGLVAYAAMPWLLLQLARASRAAPFDETPDALPRWRRSFAGRSLVLGALEAGCVAIAPGVAVDVIAAGLALVLGSLAFSGRKSALRAAGAAGAGTLVAATLLAPWVAATAASGHHALAVFGLAGGPTSQPGWVHLLLMDVGPVGASPLRWALLAASLVPIVVATGPRLAWATRWWAVALGGWLLALVSVKGWSFPFAPSPDVLLAPAAAGVAAAAGLAVATLEADVAGHRFGWRQVAAVGAVGALALGVLPTVFAAGDGRWGMPQSGFAQAAGFATPTAASAGYRVLWLGDPRALPLGGWPIGPGLAYGTSVDGTASAADLWPPASPGGAAQLARDVGVAMRGETVQLGRLLAAARVRYVVVVTALAPHTPGSQPAPAFPAPTGLVAALARQQDLTTVPESVGALHVFKNIDLAPAPARAVTGRAAGAARVLDPLAAALMLLAWLVAAAALLGRRRWLDWWWAPLRRRGGSRLDEVAPVPVPASAAAPQPEPAPQLSAAVATGTTSGSGLR